VVVTPRYSRIYLALAVTVVVSVLFLTLIYPRSFKSPDFNDFSFSGEMSKTEFEYSGFWSGCSVLVQSTEFSEPSSINSIGGILETRFSPWIPSLSGILHQEAYFHTLDFEECFEAVNSEYPNTNIEKIIFEGAPNTFLRVGGLTEFSVPLSHANTLLVFTPLDKQQKIVLLRGVN
jgi:hypothetical protein